MKMRTYAINALGALVLSTFLYLWADYTGHGYVDTAVPVLIYLGLGGRR
jgi:hypothetical protein